MTNIYQRKDFSVTNKFGQNLQSSLFVPRNNSKSNICVVYLHSMNGCRLECTFFLKQHSPMLRESFRWEPVSVHSISVVVDVQMGTQFPLGLMKSLMSRQSFCTCKKLSSLISLCFGADPWEPLPQSNTVNTYNLMETICATVKPLIELRKLKGEESKYRG